MVTVSLREDPSEGLEQGTCLRYVLQIINMGARSATLFHALEPKHTRAVSTADDIIAETVPGWSLGFASLKAGAGHRLVPPAASHDCWCANSLLIMHVMAKQRHPWCLSCITSGPLCC